MTEKKSRREGLFYSSSSFVQLLLVRTPSFPPSSSSTFSAANLVSSTLSAVAFCPKMWAGGREKRGKGGRRALCLTNFPGAKVRYFLFVHFKDGRNRRKEERRELRVFFSLPSFLPSFSPSAKLTRRCETRLRGEEERGKEKGGCGAGGESRADFACYQQTTSCQGGGGEISKKERRERGNFGFADTKLFGFPCFFLIYPD